MKRPSPEIGQRRRIARRIALFLFTIAAVLLTADYTLYPALVAPPKGRSFNTGANGNWLRDTWYRGLEKEPPSSLARRLTDAQVRYAYFHVRFIKRDGTLRYRDPAPIRRLLPVLRREAPGVRLIGWVYIGNARGLTGVELSRPEVRARIVSELRWLIDTCGFDGVQIDYEICPDGDADFLRLLREARAALPSDKLISVATPLLLPRPLNGTYGWSEAYLAEVARTSDQVVVMAYDSALWLPRAYVALMRAQATRATRAVADSGSSCRVLIGVPTYEEGGLSHHAPAENLPLALKGVREGLASPEARPAVFDGVALFADYTTDKGEWADYRRLWLGQHGRRR
jgi:hypothetical protein